MGSPTVHVELVVNSTTASKSFYQQIFSSWTFSQQNPQSGGPSPAAAQQMDAQPVPDPDPSFLAVDMGAGTVEYCRSGCLKKKAQPFSTPVAVPFFEVDDVSIALAKAVQAGGVRVVNPTQHPQKNWEYAIFKDINGIYIGVFKPT